MSPETKLLVFGEILFLCIVLLAFEARRRFGGLSRMKRRANAARNAPAIAPSRAALLARPLDSPAAAAASRRAPWEAFIGDKELLSTYRVTPSEIESLRNTAMLGTVQSKEDIVFILKTIRASGRR